MGGNKTGAKFGLTNMITHRAECQSDHDYFLPFPNFDDCY